VLHPATPKVGCRQNEGRAQGYTWQSTVLVNELYLKLVKIMALGLSGLGRDQEKAAFLLLR
jgi:hypothetical protein